MHLVEQTVVKGTVEHQPRVLAGEEDLGHQVPSPGDLDGALEVLAAQLRPAPQARWAKRIEHTQVEVRAAVLVGVVEVDDPLHQGLELGQIRDGFQSPGFACTQLAQAEPNP